MKKLLLSSFFLLLLVASCKDDDMGGGDGPEPNSGIDLTDIPYEPVPVVVEDPPGFPSMIIPADNPLTVEGVELGRRLFYDPILSSDSTISCASCHHQDKAFTDGTVVSTGVNGLTGRRNSMSLVNIGYMAQAGLFWDGRSPTLEEQALHPVEDPLEMAETWPNVEMKLQAHEGYRTRFRKAFGIENSEDITRDLATKAIAQFERTIVSANTRFDQKKYQGDNNPFLWTSEETDGFLLYFDDVTGTLAGGHCGHCHDGGALLSSERFENNAIQDVETLNDFTDMGRGGVTGITNDNGKFRTVTLRNIALTAPYMHNGQFQTLREVVEHYNSGGHYAPNVNTGSVTNLGLSEEDIDNIVAFLQTFTDTTIATNPAWSNPFQ